MNKNIKITVFFILLLQLMIGISFASEVQNEPTTTIEKQVQQDTITTNTEIKDDKTIKDTQNNNQAITNTTTTQKSKVNLSVDPINGVIGEKITLNANITDTENKPITGGNLVFKLNGKTLRQDGRFDSNAPSQKFKVENGKVNIQITADLYLRNIKNITASYSGTSKYEETRSNIQTAQIQKRKATLTVTTSPKIQKHYQTTTFTAKLTDTTQESKNTTAINTGTKVLFKINKVSLKDKNGKKILTTVENGEATYNYTIPQAMSGITKDQKIRNYTVEAVLVSDTYYPDTRNNTTFNVERNPTKIILNTSPTTYNKNMTIKGKLVDTHNNTIKNEKLQLSINGKIYTLKTDNKGTFQKTIKADKIGKNNITAAYHGSTNYLESKSKTTTTVNKIKTIITFNITNKDLHAADYAEIIGKISDENGNPLKNVDINEYITSDEKGEINEYIFIDEVGKQEITLYYNGNATHAPTKTTKNITVGKIRARIDLSTLKPTKLGEKILISGYIYPVDSKGYHTASVGSEPFENIKLNIKINNENIQDQVLITEYNSFEYEYKTKTLGTNNITITSIENNYTLSTKVSDNFLVYTPTSAPVTIPITEDTTTISRGYEDYWAYTFEDYTGEGVDRTIVDITGFESEPPLNKITEVKFYLKDAKNKTSTKIGTLDGLLHAYIDHSSSLKPYKAEIKLKEMTKSEIEKIW